MRMASAVLPLPIAGVGVSWAARRGELKVAKWQDRNPGALVRCQGVKPERTESCASSVPREIDHSTNWSMRSLERRAHLQKCTHHCTDMELQVWGERPRAKVLLLFGT